MKSDEATSKEQLLLTGLRLGMTAVDAGGGAGFVTKIMAEIVSPSGKAILVDQSSERLAQAKQHVGQLSQFLTQECSLEEMSIETGTIDYVFCRFVFEYLQNPEKVFAELLRILKPGGKLVVGDLDHNILSHYPLSPRLESQLYEVSQILAQKKLWDAYAGRKLYSHFYRHSLCDIKVHLIPHHLFYGSAADKDVQNWEAKLDRIQDLQNSGVLKLSFDVGEFRKEFMKFFRDPGRFSYSPLILVEGVKASTQ